MSNPHRSKIDPSRRKFLAAGVAAPLAAAAVQAELPANSRQASGVKVGEVTDSSAIVWARLTAAAERNTTGPKAVGKGRSADDSKLDPATLHGSCPGMPGSIRVRYGTDRNDLKSTEWTIVTETTDFMHQFTLTSLPADRVIHYAVDTESADGKADDAVIGQFRTAPMAASESPLEFAVVTCQMVASLDDPNGFHIYPAIQRLEPRFVAFTGDNVYYDNERPVANTPVLARYHWQRMYSLPRHIELLRNVATYWEKDDHDTLRDDSWPGKKMGDLTFAEGQKIFRQQVPMGDSIYRTFRWGKNLQVWFTDGRDFRSPTTDKDGPAKTIWGKEQKEWLFRTLKESDATWKVLISPTPIVGPDRVKKADNHSNKAFQHEGDEIRAWFQANVPNNFFVICGDRHWQYHSVHPETGLNEFSIGAASDPHAGGTPGEDKSYHRFHRVKGGFLTVEAAREAIVFRHRDVHGKVVNEVIVKG